jgi:hypothetical protein
MTRGLWQIARERSDLICRSEDTRCGTLPGRHTGPR